ncbi:thiamine pyrophosphate-binding protein [Raineyella fluvialis]|uniref:thiamine pyrophosphate-binding protein n=1 Tax=Raineyella fluvialis TaxID=2662261 RepID=UPI001E4D4CF4|nr:thiamine pyrophosphate-binding protein [Raineyella fluvialis]
MSKQTVADYLLERLRAWGVSHIFGYPGDGINGIVAALGRSEDHPTFVQARHEEMSAFEAVGYAKYGDAPFGVCLATSGPGAIHLLNGLYDAKLDHVPTVAIVGQTNRSAMGGAYQQEIDLITLFKDVASDYVQMVTVPQQLPGVLDRAIRVAVAQRAPTAIIIPADVQELEYVAPTHAFKMVPSSLGIEWATPVPDDDAIRRAADVLNSGERPAILIGQGARGARVEVERVADLLGAGAAKALLGKDVLSDDLPWVTGSIGLLGTRASYEMMKHCDMLLTVGSNFPYTQFMPESGQARAVQIDIDGRFIGMRYDYEVNLVGDAAATLRALIPLLRQRDHGSWRHHVEKNVAEWWESMDAEAHVDANPINPQLMFHAASKKLPPNVMVAADSGSAANWYARQLRFRPPCAARCRARWPRWVPVCRT